eukprot:747892-Heterocapsa_arctica.AAC.1
MWRFSAGLFGKHITVNFQEIPVRMSGLTAKSDLARWGTNLRMGARKIDMENLDVWDMDIESAGHKHVTINYLNFNSSRIDGDPMFDEFRIATRSVMFAMDADNRTLHPKVEHGALVSEHVKSRGILKGTIRKKLDKNL